MPFALMLLVRRLYFVNYEPSEVGFDSSLPLGTNLVPGEVFDIFENQNLVTPIDTVTKAFLSFLGDSQDNGASSLLSRMTD